MSKQPPAKAPAPGADGITWTLDEIEEFDRLADAVSSRDQLTRITARLDQTAFINLHGKAKCDAMWAHLQAGGRKEARP